MRVMGRIGLGCIGRSLFALAMVCFVATAGAEPFETDEAAATEADETTETVFDQPLDLSTPPPADPASRIDPSKFTAGLPTIPWTGKAGIDNRALPGTDWRPERWLPGATTETVGVAWANISAPGLMTWDKTSIETRVDPHQQGKLGVTLSRSVPVGDAASLTLQNGVLLTQPLQAGALPASAAVSSQPNVEGNHAVRFTILPADTTLSVGIASAEDRWRRSLSAEQKLFGSPLSVTGAVSETGSGDLSKSLKAGFKRNW